MTLHAGQRVTPSTGLLGRLQHAKRSWRLLGLGPCDLEKGLTDLDPFFLSSMLQVLAADMPAATEQAHQQSAAKPYILSLAGTQQLKPEVVSRLLLAAVRLVQELCTLPAAAEIRPDDAAHLLEQAIDVHYSGWPSYSCRDHQGRIMHCISRLPCVQSLHQLWLIGSIHAAVQHNGDVAVDLINQLPGAQDFSTKTVLQLLHSALVQGTTHVFTRLCSLPGAHGLSLSSLVTLLHAGMTEYRRAAHVQPLTDLLHALPLAKQYWRSEDTIRRLLDSAVYDLDDEQQVIEVMQCLLNVPDLECVPLNKQQHQMMRKLDIDRYLDVHDLRTAYQTVRSSI